MPLFTIQRDTLPLRRPWPVPGSGTLRRRAVGYVVGLDESHRTVAIGEAAPALGRGETIDQAIHWMRQHAHSAGLTDHAALMEWLSRQNGVPRAAAAAFETAALDFQARRAGLPLWRHLSLPCPDGAPIPVVLAPADLKDYEADLELHERAPVLLLRLGMAGPERDLDCVKLARIKTDAALRVHAGGAWRPDRVLDLVRAVAALGVEYIEQPLPPGQLEAMTALRAQSPVALFLDQDVAAAEDVERAAPACDGVRLTLQRCGGITALLRAMIRARELGLLVTLGCDLESPVSATAAAHLAALADYCDFGATAFLENTAYQGLRLQSGALVVPPDPGIGVSQ